MHGDFVKWKKLHKEFLFLFLLFFFLEYLHESGFGEDGHAMIPNQRQRLRFSRIRRFNLLGRYRRF